MAGTVEMEVGIYVRILPWKDRHIDRSR
jgi:hypothetical protein